VHPNRKTQTPSGRIFLKFDNFLGFFENSIKEIEALLKSDNNITTIIIIIIIIIAYRSWSWPTC
jgi:type IV secretory pathway TrbL component